MADRSVLLLLIDLQVAFCDDRGSMARQGWDISALKRAASRCNLLAAAARAAGTPVVWTRMVFQPDYSDGGLLTSRIRPNLKQIGALRRGSGDEDLCSAVEIEPNDLVIDKARFSALYATPLEMALRSRSCESVVVAGVTTSMCVETTVRDLAQRDYSVLVVEEACADFNRQRHDASAAAMAFGFASLISSTEADLVFRETSAR